MHRVSATGERPSQLPGATSDLEYATSATQSRSARHGLHKPRRVARPRAVVLGRVRAEYNAASAGHEDDWSCAPGRTSSAVSGQISVSFAISTPATGKVPLLFA